MDEGARVTGTVASFTRRMSDSDALLWNIERDPVLRSTIVAIAVLERGPDWERLVDRMELASRMIPRLRQRVGVSRLRTGPPSWVDDPGFDLAYHLRRIRAPRSASLRDVLDVAAPIAMTAFDSARPPWEFTLVEDFDDGRAALVQKIHHSLTDGIGGIRLAMMLVDLEPDGTPAPEALAADVVTRPPGLLDAMLTAPTRALGAGVQSARGTARVALGALTRPGPFLRDAAHVAAFGARLLTPVGEPMSPVLRGRGLGRHLDVLDVPLDRLHTAAGVAGVSINDAFVAALAGGLRVYHEQHGVAIEELRMTMPINLRADDDPLGGNRFSPARFAVPVGIRDPAERMHAIAALSHQWRDEPALALTDVVAAGLNRLPATVTTRILGSMLKGIDFVATNVPGIPIPVFLAGAEVLREYAFAPPSGSAVSFALVSHRDTCCIGVNVDTTAVSDPARLVGCLADAFDEILELAPEERVPEDTGPELLVPTG
jgi:diacylglycerol O-acyltransferase / wax synthase